MDKNGHPQQKIDLFDKERHENSELTCAREVSPGFIVRLPSDASSRSTQASALLCRSSAGFSRISC